jgi:inhibitor-of-growth protein 1
MQNQAAVEALYSATFVEDYLDCVENLPNDLQRHLSRLREFDLTQYSEFLRDLDSLVSAFEKEKTAAGQRQVLAKIQLGLIAAQDIGDDKLATVQAMTDLIENKARQLEHDAKNLEDEDENLSQTPISSKDIAPKPTAKRPSNINDDKNEKGGPAKKPRKKQHKDDKPKADRSEFTKDDVRESTPTNRPGNVKSEGNRRGGTNTPNSSGTEKSAPGPSAGKKGGNSTTKGNKSNKGKKNSEKLGGNDKSKHDKDLNNDKDDSDDIDPSAFEIDPDEPTYCLCDQVSYGEMIGCDNDLCPIEWFHFNCVQLSKKPTGSWYCPKCRGDKPTKMKAKAQFLKELEKYNKEREEKLMKQNG